MIWTNPEFRKNIWLEFSPARLVLMPAILGAIFLITTQGVRNDAEAYYQGGLWTFGIMMALWATLKASRAILDEIKDNTWDFQRMSSLKDHELALGKLFGSTSYVWYGGLMCLLLSCYGYISHSDIKADVQVSLPYILFVFIAAALISQALCLIMGTAVSSYGVMQNKLGTFGYQIVGFFAFVFLTIPIESWMGLSERGGPDVMHWHGMRFEEEVFYFFTLCCFLFWAMVGLIRTMRRALKIGSYPVAWAVFLLTTMIFIAGFIDVPVLDRGDVPFSPGLSLSLFIAFMFAMLTAYAMAFAEANDMTAYTKTILNVRKGNWPAFFKSVPLWLISFVFAFVTWAALMIVVPSFSDMGGRFTQDMALSVHGFLIALLLFAVRDLCVLHYLYFSPKRKGRAPAAFVIYLVIAYWLMPAIALVTGSKTFAGFFVPLPENDLLQSILPVLVQAGIAGVLLYRRWIGIRTP